MNASKTPSPLERSRPVSSRAVSPQARLAATTPRAAHTGTRRGQPRDERRELPPRLVRALGLTALTLAGSCLDRPIGSEKPITTNVFTTRLQQQNVDQLDLLFMIDNSASMNDKQLILETAVPDLVSRLINPACVDADGRRYDPPAPGERCGEGRRREFRPVSDINVGVISSSLGDAGAGIACSSGATLDGAHLIGTLPRGSDVETNGSGFISFGPGSDPDAFARSFQALVRRVGEQGCGFEASLEAWYRFLIDPAPYRELEKRPCAEGSRATCVGPTLGSDGQPLLDQELLAQRAAFLRPQSLLAIVMLSDENDCSLQAHGQAWLPTTHGPGFGPMFAGSAACADDPSSECCYPCVAEPPAGCEWAHASCESSGERLPPEADDTNLRCFEQKRRFGADFLYPTQRYVNALTRPRICLSRDDLSEEQCPGGVVANPLFAGGRDESSVFLAGIVGVPWQQIAADRDESGSALPDDVLRFKTAAELSADDWASMLGDPHASPPLPPSEPLMRESTVARPGVSVGGPNGREYDTIRGASPGPTDLQYACIFPLTETRECEGLAAHECDCTKGSEDSPLCEQRPGVDPPTTVQHWAKAYPGLRQLDVLKGYGENSIVASICARNVSEPERADFGYRPAIASIVDRLKEQLGQRCLPRPLEVSPDGSVPCTLVEARPAAGSCECDAARARVAPDALLSRNVRRQLASLPGGPCGADDPSCSGACLCEIEQLVEGPALTSCQNDQTPGETDGWCYVADTGDQTIGNPELVAPCPATERHLLRLSGSGLDNGAVTLISCTGQSFAR